MDLKTLSLVLTDETRDGPALAAAGALALREDAHLDIVALGVEPVPLEALPMASAQILIETGRSEAQAQARRLADWAQGALPPGLRAAIEPLSAQSLGLSALAARAARHSDLAVSGRPYGPGVAALAPLVAESLLFGARVPVLFVPDAGGGDWSRPWGRVCIAWNDSDEALRAVRGALPLLRAAGQADIAIIDPPLHGPGRADPGGALSLWLARHGVRCEVSVMARTEPRVADVLLRFCRERGCEAIVMGAYGHSRLREAVLGGATRDMLTDLPLPVVMAR